MSYDGTGNEIWKVPEFMKRGEILKQPTHLCGWCGGTKVTTSREGCYGSIIHIICSCCHHEWDEVL